MAAIRWDIFFGGTCHKTLKPQWFQDFFALFGTEM